jgi:hypothetical protein
MLEQNRKQNSEHTDAVEYRNGCPLCEHSDQELELELQAWAQLLYDHFSSQQENAGFKGAALNVDSGSQSLTLKERSKKQSKQTQQA